MSKSEQNLVIKRPRASLMFLSILFTAFRTNGPRRVSWRYFLEILSCRKHTKIQHYKKPYFTARSAV